MSTTKAKTGEVYATQLHDGRWCACQVIRAATTEVELLALDWIGDEPPSLEDLDEVGGLEVEEAGELVPCRVNAGPIPPWRFELVGRKDPVATFERHCASWSGWGFIPYQVHAWWRWNHQVSEEVKAARREQHRRRGERVKFVLDGREHTLDASTWRIWLGPEELRGVAHQLTIDPDHDIDWDALEPLSTLSEVHYTGRDASFIEFLESRPFVTRMLWRGHGQERLDLSKTWLEGISIEVGEGPLEVILPPVARSLSLVSLSGDPSIRVIDSREGWALWLSVRHREIPRRLEGLPALRNLSVWSLEEADAARLAAFPALQSLELRGAPGTLRGAGALSDLPDLRELVIRDLYDIPTDELPPADSWPALDTFEGSGLPTRDAEALRQRFAGLRVLSIREARSDAWFRANLDNPFMDWVDEAPMLGRRACRAFETASNALSLLGKAGDTVRARRVLEAFVDTFNELDARHRLGPVRAEAVADAYEELIEGCELALDARVAFEWYDARRRF